MNLLSRCMGSPLNRRNFLHVGAIGALGLTLDQYMRLQAAEPAKKKPKAEACIHIFLPGGQAHQESWDPKPFAPIEYRGQMGTVKTKIEGEVFNECLPKMASLADQITVCRAQPDRKAPAIDSRHDRHGHRSGQPQLILSRDLNRIRP